MRDAGGDLNDREAVLSQSALQFGRYRSKTFLWLLGNDVGWAVSIMAQHEKERGNRQHPENDAQWDNKDMLYRYF